MGVPYLGTYHLRGIRSMCPCGETTGSRSEADHSGGVASSRQDILLEPASSDDGMSEPDHVKL